MHVNIGIYVTLILLLVCIVQTSSKKYEPNWESIDSRPLPGWFDDSKVGILIHWGVFSVPSILSEWFWYQWKTKTPVLVDFMKENYRPDFTYPDFAPQLTAEFFNAEEWANLLKLSGAKYVVLVAKHHEGYTMWPSNYSWNWNSMDVGPKRDIVGEVADAIRKNTDMHFGLYHSLFEWFNPIFEQDRANGFKTQDFVSMKTMPELYEIVNKYKPEIIWSDGSHAAKDDYWNATNFLAWLYNDSPVKDYVVTNDRWGVNDNCIHGGFVNCGDRFNPKVLHKRKWENVMTLDRYSAGYRRNAKLADYFSVHELLTEVAQTVSCGGNILINIGITKEGTITPVFQNILLKLGGWLEVNGEAIYGSRPWLYQSDNVTKDVWYTSNMVEQDVFVYAILLSWPRNNNTVSLGSTIMTTSTTVVSMLGYNGNFSWRPNAYGGIDVTIPPIPFNLMPSVDAWVLKISGLKNVSRRN
ncbi:tissue alpha-L-fucosidase-like [Mytilus trossulus]|uniref:tissue alpha-L-fucosidase-like n=1 Tax=Mytilus trossulus TaxID=6551 RepID=UPI003005AA1A